MEPLARVLAHPGSDLAWLLGHQLTGLRAALAAAAATRPGDPAAADCHALVQALDGLLGARPAAAGAPDGPVRVVHLLAPDPLPPGPAADAAAGTRQGGSRPDQPPAAAADALAAPIRSDPRLAAMLPAGRWRTGSEGWWTALHLAGLALGPAAARDWAARLADLLGGEPGAAGTLIAGPLDLPLVPGRAGTGALRIGAGAAPDPRIAGLSATWRGADWEGEAIARIAPYVSLWLGLAGRLPGLVHCLEAVNKHGIIAFAGDQRDRYETELVARFGNLAASAGAPLSDRVAAWVRLDEAMQALFFQPIEDPRGRWGVWKEGLRQIVLDWAESLRREGAPLSVRLLPADYPQSQREGLTRRGNDIPLAGEPLGTVLATLRLWWRLDRQVEPGRALYGNG